MTTHPLVLEALKASRDDMNANLTGAAIKDALDEARAAWEADKGDLDKAAAFTKWDECWRAWQDRFPRAGGTNCGG